MTVAVAITTTGLCVSGQPTAMPTAAPVSGACGAEAAGAWFRVTNAVPTYTCSGPTSEIEGTCFTILNGSCVTDGDNDYGNNERCMCDSAINHHFVERHKLFSSIFIFAI